MAKAFLGGKRKEKEDDFINLYLPKGHPKRNPGQEDNYLMRIEVKKGWVAAKEQGRGTPFNKPGFVKAWRQWKEHTDEAIKKGYQTRFPKPEWKEFLGHHLFHPDPTKKVIHNSKKHTVETQLTYRSLVGNHGVTVCYIDDMYVWQEMKKEKASLKKPLPTSPPLTSVSKSLSEKA